MALQDVVLKGFENIFQQHSILSISGESGTGKTSLALFLISQSLVNNNNSCLWIQASEQFPKKRLVTMYKNQKKKCDYLLNNVYITPNKVISSYSEQNKILRKIRNKNFPLPPDIRFIVIDNISHHLRFEISKVNDIRKRTSILDNFYDNILCPLILRCQRENITLILLHEVSFNVKLQKTLPFFHSLYKRIKGMFIFLSKSSISKERTMKIELEEKIALVQFRLDNNGFKF
ncbi:MAG: hypothetical protein ACFFFT_09840 [Candidatus Thorarchaeota archaeon]